MNRNSRKFSEVWCVCLFLLALLAPSTLEAADKDSFALRIEIPKQEYEMGEIISVVSRLRNLTDKPINVQRLPRPRAANDFAVRLLFSGVEIPIGLTQFGISFRDPYLKDWSTVGYPLRAGSEEVRQWDVNRHYEMSSPGTYRFSQYLDISILEVPKKPVRVISNDVTVIVKPKVEKQ